MVHISFDVLFISATASTTNVSLHRIYSLSQREKVHSLALNRVENSFLALLAILMEITGQQCLLQMAQCSSCTCDDVRVYIEGIVGWVNTSLLVVLLAEGERAAIHANTIDVCIASHCGLW